MKSGSESSVSGAVSHMKDFTANLWRQMAKSSFQDVFLSLQDVTEGSEHFSNTLHSQETQKSVRERVVASRSRYVR